MEKYRQSIQEIINNSKNTINEILALLDEVETEGYIKGYEDGYNSPFHN